MKCNHIDYDDYFEKCNDCGLTGQQIHKEECGVEGTYSLNDEGQCESCGTIVQEYCASCKEYVPLEEMPEGDRCNKHFKHQSAA